MEVKLSVAVITLNEEKNIGRCLASVQSFADDIVVVDSFSTDKTESICNEYKARFIKNPFQGHIEQKNFALQQAKYDHILCLDADEAIDETLRQNIVKVLKNWKSDACSMNRLTNYCGKWIHHTGWYPDTKIRLFDRRKGKWGGTNPHDQIVLQKDATCTHIKGDILHYSYYSIAQHITQMNYFTDIMAKEAYQKKKKAGFIKLFLSPGFKFFKKYVLQQGFRDGYYGLVISILSGFYTYLKYLKLKELNKKSC
ncbi:MAG: glycosyltransferase family 2 protein [Bacteroidota bacterium]